MDQEHSPDTHPALSFTASRGSFLRLLLINALLTVLTLGIYRFWAKTRVRRYLWSHIRFLDDPLEYTGTAGELFLGFLIVIAVLFPLGFAYTTIQTLVPPGSGWLHIALEVLYYMVLFALLQIGFYRAWRYRMSRTRWRGIRLGLDGSSWEYLKLASGWTLLTFLTLGLAYPWMQVELWRYQMRHTHIGQETFSFHGIGRELLPDWLWVNVPIIVGIGLLGSLPFVSGSGSFSIEETIAGLDANVTGAFPFMAAGGALALVIAAGMFFRFGLVAARYRITHLRAGRTSTRSSLSIMRLIGAGAFAMVVAVLTFLISAGIAGALGAAFADTVKEATVIGQILGIAIGLFAVVIVFPLIWAVIFSFSFLKNAILTTHVSAAAHLEAAAQRPSADMKSGEGLADALDIGGL